jgi:hypothetical protein
MIKFGLKLVTMIYIKLLDPLCSAQMCASAFGHKQTHAPQKAMSALPRKQTSQISSDDMDQPGPFRRLYLVLDFVQRQVVILGDDQFVPAFDGVPLLFRDTGVDSSPARPIHEYVRHDGHLQSLGV